MRFNPYIGENYLYVIVIDIHITLHTTHVKWFCGLYLVKKKKKKKKKKLMNVCVVFTWKIGTWWPFYSDYAPPFRGWGSIPTLVRIVCVCVVIINICTSLHVTCNRWFYDLCLIKRKKKSSFKKIEHPKVFW